MENIKAKKKYGQNFLIDNAVLNGIIQAMPNNENYLVEIGPGLGDLTEKLVKYKDMTAYEVDTDLVSVLRSKFKDEIDSNKLELIHTDVLRTWESQKTLHEGKYDLIANLPYYIATNIILRALEDANCEHIIVMIQKEVAVKFTAKVNDKEYSSLGIISQLLTSDSKILFDVSPESFNPAPKVVSSILYLRKNMTNSLSGDFKKFLKACFSQPRKKLSKNLSSILEKSEISQIFNELDINDNKRPHEVSASLYSQMYTKVKNGREKSSRG
ncbi:16S rRNA (adenine1518-N6/adenine1519-N6)-dimethyltransferase [Malaciobacter marinus]|uniref:Ribosomal RNA small subunit methyltransferase A n=1 Tax=Malaciobacter marinus TaxID=505249 RepID=A0A347TGX0_9BACT|nr:MULTISPECIES: 16S rRNA (adenine(1518)-N(6)/adenine(1519)-N(6))-dimethyltransferase RsmA [Malaciobacter]AXX85848.1 16S rRNA (adenine1518-N6/adenine1519-N6)-dimethyltransferase [Malaciobacter marinus]PHO12840.1 16S rRNA (adenine(1518)-N(6)/adenine(1519)-N(6))-dimethyltransferase [Malaciobacter marinus]PHO15026.1 16S rRNA (adenine(1518)-N(6)/adenine(1519)-N(6))-dimethyltransferase [Malaciobacter marinus]RYA24350.1 16S rRNA (adenine(1518)-N(6)/adenine(1519)-N(6))-dimethyltransferase RsmA [Malaci